MPNILKITAENADELLNASAYGAGAVIQVQNDTTEAFGAPSDTGTVALVSGTRAYTFYHTAGVSSTWYRTRYENAAGTTTSDWTAAFQAGGEEAGLLCSIYDVKQRLADSQNTWTTSEEELLTEMIGQVSAQIESYTGRWLSPRPASGDAVYRVHTCHGGVLPMPKGIRSITTLGLATDDQPASGGTYATITATDYYIDPPEMNRTAGWPGIWIRLRRQASAFMYEAAYGAEITGQFGFADVPRDINRVALTLVAAAWRERGSSGGDSFTIGIGGERTWERALSRFDRDTLDGYRMIPVG